MLDIEIRPPSPISILRPDLCLQLILYELPRPDDLELEDPIVLRVSDLL